MEIRFGRIIGAAAVAVSVVLLLNYGMSPIYKALDLTFAAFDSANVLISESGKNVSGDTEKAAKLAAPQENKPEKEEPNDTSEPETQAAANDETALGAVVRRTVAGGEMKYGKISLNNKSHKSIDIKKSLSGKVDLALDSNSTPQVLIYHTHATEGYMRDAKDYYTAADNARNTDNSANVTAVGDAVQKSLSAAGINTLHNTTQHDNPSYSGSYKRSAATIKQALSENKDIKLAIDLHRDSIPAANNGKTAPICNIAGKNAAQVMIIVSTGYVGAEQNFTLALRLQQTVEVLYPGLARPMIVYESRYNQELVPFGLLIEVGTEANSVDEATYAGELLGNALKVFLNDYIK